MLSRIKMIWFGCLKPQNYQSFQTSILFSSAFYFSFVHSQIKIEKKGTRSKWKVFQLPFCESTPFLPCLLLAMHLRMWLSRLQCGEEMCPVGSCWTCGLRRQRGRCFAWKTSSRSWLWRQHPSRRKLRKCRQRAGRNGYFHPPKSKSNPFHT